jgi:hypothetical protein
MFRAPLRLKISVAALVIVFCVAGRLSAQNLVANPGFETGDFPPAWTVTTAGNPPFTSVQALNAFGGPHSGSFYCDSERVGSFDSILQSIATTPGAFYDLNFWLANNAFTGGPTEEVQVFWNGTLVYDRTDTASFFSYILISVPNLVASGSSTTLEFRMRNDPGLYELDDVSVTSSVLGNRRLQIVSKVASTVTLTIDSLTGYAYQLQRSDTLLPGSFADIGSPQNGTTGSPLTFTDPGATGPKEFYRVVITKIGPAPPPPVLTPRKVDLRPRKSQAAKKALQKTAPLKSSTPNN